MISDAGKYFLKQQFAYVALINRHIAPLLSTYSRYAVTDVELHISLDT